MLAAAQLYYAVLTQWPDVEKGGTQQSALLCRENRQCSDMIDEDFYEVIEHLFSSRNQHSLI